MWELIHIAGCGGVCYRRSSQPELHTKLDEKDSFNLDGTPVERNQAVICQSCGEVLKVYNPYNEVHPSKWRHVDD